MAASSSDCIAKSRMLVSNMRCTIISSCTTSISAARSVMSCELISVDAGGFMVSERGTWKAAPAWRARTRRSTGPARGTGAAWRWWFRPPPPRPPAPAASPQRPAALSPSAAGDAVRRDADREEHIHQQRHQHELLDGRAPFHEREVTARVFEQHRLVNHRQLQVRGRVVHRDAARLGQQHDEQRGKRQHVRRVRTASRSAPALLSDHLAEVGRTRA